MYIEHLILYRDKLLLVLHIGKTFLSRLRAENTPMRHTELNGDPLTHNF